MSRCGRCRGRLVIKAPTGLAMIPCPDCRDGVKTARSGLGRGKVSVPLPPGATCKVCGDPAVHNHHVVSQNRIDRFVPDEHQRRAKEDIRNLVACCYECHDNIENTRVDLAPHELHDDFWGFVHEYELEGGVPRYMQEAA